MHDPERVRRANGVEDVDEDAAHAGFVECAFAIEEHNGEDVTGDTLARFYALHVVVFPLLTFAVLGLHLYLVQKHGMSVPERVTLDVTAEGRPRSMPFFPNFLLHDMVGWYLALGVLAALAALFPWELGNKADPIIGWSAIWDTREYYETQYRIMQSDRVLAGVVRDLSPQNDAAFLGYTPTSPAPLESTIVALRGRLTVEPVKGSRLVLVKVQDTSPAQARRHLPGPPRP